MLFKRITGQINRFLKPFILGLMPLVQSGHGLQQIITGVKLTLLTVVQSYKEILILEETQQLTENHLILQIKPSTILRDSFMRNQIALKT